MKMAATRSVCWQPAWNLTRLGLEHLLLSEGLADSTLLAVTEDGVPFRLIYRLTWDTGWRLKEADLLATSHRFRRMLGLRTDGQGKWSDADGHPIAKLDGCLDIDIWPTPFTNTFPIRRQRLRIGERREFRMAWVLAPDLKVKSQSQAYTRLDDRTYLFESLDGSGFKARLPVDAQGVVLDYPKLFKRVPRPHKALKSPPPQA